MPDLDDNSLERLLRDHLSNELSGQTGRAVQAFTEHARRVPEGSPGLRLAGEKPPQPRERGRIRPWSGWMLGLAGAAVAASITGIFTAPATWRHGAPALPVQSVTPSSSDTPSNTVASARAKHSPDLAEVDQSPDAPLIHWVQRQTFDEGTVVLDDPANPVPARRVREQEVEHTQWYDPAQRARVEMSVPRENVKFVEMDTY